MVMRRIGNQDFSASDCQIRRTRCQNEDPAIQVEQEEPSNQEDVAVRAAMLVADITEALAGLTARQRGILQLVIQEEMTVRQAAERLGIAPTTLHDDYRRARDCLAKKLDKYRLRR
jgi:RNA polymerase sigma factor (sigma-70 family)